MKSLIALDRLIECAIAGEKPEFARRFEDPHPEPRLDQRGERCRYGSRRTTQPRRVMAGAATEAAR